MPTFQLSSATVPSANRVTLTFNSTVDANAAAYSPASYDVSGDVTVIAVLEVTGSTVRLYTTGQTGGTSYRITVSGAVTSGGSPLVTRTATFTGVAVTPPFVVTQCLATTVPTAKQIAVAWSPPAGTVSTWVIRTTKGWPIYDKDYYVVPTPGTVVYSDTSGTAFPFFVDNVPNAQTYYYYTILVSPNVVTSISDFDVDDSSYAYALAIDNFQSKDNFFWANTPAIYKEQDAIAVAQGGGGGALDKLYTVMGAWLDLMRGNMAAIPLRNDPDRAPINSLIAVNNALGFSGDGQTYDWTALRRTYANLARIYKSKGTCEGVNAISSTLTGWSVTCVEFGQDACMGVTNLKTWDGRSSNDIGQQSAVINITQTITTAAGNGRIAVVGKGAAWATPDQFTGGKIRSGLGNVACVIANGSLGGSGYVDTQGAAAFSAVTPFLYTNASAGDLSIVLYASMTTDPVRPGLTLQLVDAYTLRTEFVDVVTVSNIAGIAYVVTLKAPLQYAYVIGSLALLQHSLLRAEERGNANSFASASATLTDSRAYWTENQWVGFVLLYEDNTQRTIVSNTGNTLTTSGPTMTNTGSRGYRIAKAFSSSTYSSATAYVSYILSKGPRTTIFDPCVDLELASTRWDHRNRTWQGMGTTLLGSWGPLDVGLYLNGAYFWVRSFGRAAGLRGTATLLRDPTSTPSGAVTLEGMYLNPNQNQTELFEIIESTDTTITVNGDISSLVVVGQPYFVLRKSDANRYRSLSSRLYNEFTDTDVRPRLQLV